MAEASMPTQAESMLTREKSSLTTDISTKDKASETTKALARPPKKSFSTKLKETFIAEDARDVGDYIVWDILIPTIKKTIRDIIVGSADRIFLGTTSVESDRLYTRNGVTTVRPQKAYSTISTNARNRQVDARSTPQVVSPRNNFEILDWTFSDRGQLEKAFDDMLNVLDEYGRLTVNEYADILSRYFDGIPQLEYTTQLYGWRSLSSASIVNTVNGYYLKTPRPIIVKE